MKQLDETYYKNVTNPDGSYTQHLMKGDKCYGFANHTKAEIEAINRLGAKIEHEMWYGKHDILDDKSQVENIGIGTKEQIELSKDKPYGHLTTDKIKNIFNTIMSTDKEPYESSKPNLTEGHSEIEIEKQRVWEKHNKHEGAVKGYKKDRNKQTHLTPPKKKRRK